MEDLTDQLGGLEVQGWSPDGNIRASTHGRSQISVRFTPGTYHRYRDTELAHQLGQLATLLWTRYQRERVETVEVHLGGRVVTETADDRWFAERRQQLTVQGISPSGRVAVSSRALVRWEFTIAEGTVQALPEERFRAELDAALAELLRDHRTQLMLLAGEVYDFGGPAHTAVRPENGSPR